MKTILKLSLFVTALICFNLANAQPGDPEDPCPGWPFCDSVTVSEKVYEVEIVSDLINEEASFFPKENKSPNKEELPELFQNPLKAILDKDEV